MTFGEKLQTLRAQRGLSQDALAEALDVSRQAVSRWERDETLPETEKVIRLSRYFQVTTDYLLLEEAVAPERPALVRLHVWWADRSWLLGVGLAAVGALWLLRLLTGSWTYMRMLTEGNLTWFQAAAQYLFACLERIAAAGGLVVAGTLTAALGRKRQGALRWHHLGWTAAFWGAADLVIQGLITLWLFSLLERGQMGFWALWLEKGGALLFALGTAALGLAAALLGPKLDLPRTQETVPCGDRT